MSAAMPEIAPHILWELQIPGGPMPDVEAQRRLASSLVQAFRSAAEVMPLGTCPWQTWAHYSLGSTYVKITAAHASWTLRISGHRNFGIFHSDHRGVPSAGLDLFLLPSGNSFAAWTILSKALCFFSAHQGFRTTDQTFGTVSADEIPDPVFAKPSAVLVVKQVRKGLTCSHTVRVERPWPVQSQKTRRLVSATSLPLQKGA